jgi:hypothetical protein
MLPEFPQFKKLELTDKKDVETITSLFPPYSDFNFISLWSWDLKNEMMLSNLNGNLVVRFTDYLTGKPFYSFLGDQKVNETVETLLEFSKKENIKPILRLVPEIAGKSLDLKKYSFEEDPDHFDYIYKNENLSHFLGEKFKNKRYMFNKFKNTYKDLRILISDKIDEKTKEDIIKLDEKWAKRKIEKQVDFDVKNDTLAIKKLFQSLPEFSQSKFIFLCLYIGEELVGFSISSIINPDYVLCHFTKGDTKYAGVYEYMLKSYGEHVNKIAHFMNYEQDLGIPSLRFSKNSFRPSSFLKKYVIVKL